MRFIVTALLIAFSAATPALAVEGYYKDLFMDGGASLSSRTTLPASDTLGLSMEFLATSSSTFQNSIMVECDHDVNGYLLYPDGQPRFRTIYTNGGSATGHGNSLGEDGRQRIRDFFNKGGCYTGSCAGAFIASLHYQNSGIWEAYYHIWPGRTVSTGLMDTYTGHSIEPGAALLDYYDFGGDMSIDNIYHNGGCYARETIDWPPETEIQLRYDYPGYTMDDKPSCWAYKSADTTGRLVVIGSHPEGISGGERLELMCAMIRYALDGRGDPKVKGELSNGIVRIMDRETGDDDPAFTKIGDLQYHHFTAEIPEGATNFTVTLIGETGYDFNLYLKNGGFAFESMTDLLDTAGGGLKILTVPSPASGTWFIGVKCDTTIEAVNTADYYYYTGALEILDGLEYRISAQWDTTSIAAGEIAHATAFALGRNYPNPFNASTTIDFDIRSPGRVRIEIFSSDGRLVRTLSEGHFDSGSHSVVWNSNNNSGAPAPSGIYMIRMTASANTASRKILLIR